MEQLGHNFTSGLYWRRSPINARQTVPVVLVLHSGVLTLSDSERQVFSVPVTQVRAKFTALSTMMLHVEGVKYPIVGRGGAISPAFTPQQIAYLQSAHAPIAPLPESTLDFLSLVQNIAPWRDILRAAGAAT